MHCFSKTSDSRHVIVLSALDITVLLALTVYQLIVSDQLPDSSESVPLIGRYYVALSYYH